MKKNLRKLSLNRETLRRLQLEEAMGGILNQPSGITCNKSCGTTCVFGFCYTQSCPDVCVPS